MPVLPEGYKTAIVLSLDCASIDKTGQSTDAVISADVCDYLQSVVALVNENSASLQVFTPVNTLTQHAEVFQKLHSQGHVVDAMIDLEADAFITHLEQENTRFSEIMGESASGLRLLQMQRNGIQAELDLQQAALETGLVYSSTDYSSKNPDHGSLAWADKNATMIMKHQQPRWYPTGLLEIPSAGFSDRMFFCEQERSLSEWLDHVRQCIDFACDMSLLYAPYLSVEVLSRFDAEGETFKVLIEYAKKKFTPVLFCTHRQIAQWEIENKA